MDIQKDMTEQIVIEIALAIKTFGRRTWGSKFDGCLGC
jgi:hypothetical protein